MWLSGERGNYRARPSEPRLPRRAAQVAASCAGHPCDASEKARSGLSKPLYRGGSQALEGSGRAAIMLSAPKVTWQEVADVRLERSLEDHGQHT